MSKRILFVLTEASSALMHRKELIYESMENNLEVSVIFLENKNNTDLSILESQGINFYDFGFKRKNLGFFSIIIFIFKFLSLVKRGRYSIVHSFGIYNFIACSISLSLFKGPKLVATIAGRGSLFLNKKYFISGNISRLVIKSFLTKNKDLNMIFHNQSDLDYLVSNPSLKKYHLIRGSGVDTNLFRPNNKFENDIIQVAYIGRFISDKGVNDFIAVAKKITKTNPNVIFNLIGSIDIGNPSSLSPKEIKKLSKYKNINLFNVDQHDMPNQYNKIHIVCLPSKHEGLPRVLIEAGASEIACIASDVPGCNEVIVDGLNGYLFEYGDLNKFENLLLALIENKNLRIQFGKKARELVKSNFDIKKILKQHMSLYRKIINE